MARLTKEQMVEVMFNLDEQADEREDLPAMVTEREIDLDGLVYIAEQSALRSCLMIDGRDPRKLPREGLSLVQLSSRSRELLPAIMATFLDGFLVGIDCERGRS